MSINDALDKRMREYYESASKTRLVRRMPVILRVDGKAFRTFTRGFNRPFDYTLNKSMQETTKYLCENIQGCKLGYTQSDEISLLLVDYDKLDTDAWFDNEVQKMCSITASMATLAFNKFFTANVNAFLYNSHGNQLTLEYTYKEAVETGALFDCKAFNVPKEDVTNYFYSRQLNAMRNSVAMVARVYFSDKELHKKSTNDMKEMLLKEKNVDWESLHIYKKRGAAVIKTKTFIDKSELEYTPKAGALETFNGKQGIWRNKWFIDTGIPEFKGEDRDYIDKLVNI